MNGAELASSIAGHGLAHRRLPQSPMADGAWRALVAAVTDHRLTGLLYAAILDGSLLASPSQVREAASLHEAALSQCLRLERVLVEVSLLFERHSIDLRVLKGPAVAHLDYADPTLRCFGDIDILVRSNDIDGAVRVLAGAGYERGWDELRPGFDRKFTKAVSFRIKDGLQLDLHRTLVLGPFGHLIKLDDLWDEGEAFILGGRRLRALGREQRFLHACLHAVCGDYPSRLAPLRDVIEIGSHDDLSPLRLARFVDRWRAAVVVDRATEIARRELDATDTALRIPALHGRLTERGLLALYTGRFANYTTKASGSVLTIPGTRNKWEFLRAAVLSSPGRQLARIRARSARAWSTRTGSLGSFNGGGQRREEVHFDGPRDQVRSGGMRPRQENPSRAKRAAGAPGTHRQVRV